MVEVIAEGGNQLRPVRTGISNDQLTEVVEGLQEGEQVLVANTTTAGVQMPMARPAQGPVMIQR